MQLTLFVLGKRRFYSEVTRYQVLEASSGERDPWSPSPVRGGLSECLFASCLRTKFARNDILDSAH